MARARTALASVFAIKGVAFAAMVARIPAIRHTLDLSTGQLGLLMLCFSGGAIAGLPIAGSLVRLLGPRRAVVISGATVGVGLFGLSAALFLPWTPPAVVGMALVGLGNGVWDVAINVEGVDIERRTDGLLLPRLHGMFSVGTMVGAGIGTGAAAVAVPLAWQLGALAIVVPVSLAVLSRRFLTRGARAAPAAPAPGAGLPAAWREPRTLLIGLVVFGFAFTEGSANDWIAIAFVDGHRVDEAIGALAYWMFVMAMTVGRLAGGRLVARAGRVAVLRGSAVMATLGLLFVLWGDALWLALIGPLLWGVGSALGFPLGISAAGDRAAARAAQVSVVSSIGYTAFLAGPPVLGLLAGRVGILNALLLVLAAPLMAFLAAAATRPPDEGHPVERQPGDRPPVERHPGDAHRTPHA
jgi:MFS family permease